MADALSRIAGFFKMKDEALIAITYIKKPDLGLKKSIYNIKQNQKMDEKMSKVIKKSALGIKSGIFS